MAFWKVRNEKPAEQLEMGSVPESKKMDRGRPGMKGFLDISGIQVMMGKAGRLEAQAPRMYFYLGRETRLSGKEWV